MWGPDSSSRQCHMKQATFSLNPSTFKQALNPKSRWKAPVRILSVKAQLALADGHSPQGPGSLEIVGFRLQGLISKSKSFSASGVRKFVIWGLGCQEFWAKRWFSLRGNGTVM